MAAVHTVFDKAAPKTAARVQCCCEYLGQRVHGGLGTGPQRRPEGGVEPVSGVAVAW